MTLIALAGLGVLVWIALELTLIRLHMVRNLPLIVEGMVVRDRREQQRVDPYPGLS